MLNSRMKDKLKAGKSVFGTFVKLNSPGLVEILGKAGFDFIIIDGEHSTFTYPDIENMIRAADCVNMSSVVRIPEATEAQILHALDSGAGGVQIPGLAEVSEVKEAVKHAKYYPLGTRGLSFAQRSADYSLVDSKEYIAKSNELSSIVIHIENITMARQIEELCSIEQVDVLFIGPADLSQSMGKPGQLNDPEVVEVIENIFSVAKKHNKNIGIYIANEASYEKYSNLGATYLVWQSDVAMFANAAKESIQLKRN